MTHDIQAIRSQVETLDRENQRLQELYPGARARGVAERQVILILIAVTASVLVLDPSEKLVFPDVMVENSRLLTAVSSTSLSTQ